MRSPRSPSSSTRPRPPRRSNLGRLLRVYGHSMSPALKPGQLVLVREGEYGFRDPRRGEIVAARPASGRPPKLPMRLRPRLEKLLLRGAEAAGYAQDLWTCPRIAQLIGREFNVHYHVAHVGRLLRRLGWTPQRPRRRARERDDEQIQRWTKVDWPRIKKKPVG